MSKTQDCGIKLEIVLLKLMRLHSEPHVKIFGASEQLLRPSVPFKNHAFLGT